jgi:hypothetical protein
VAVNQRREAAIRIATVAGAALLVCLTISATSRATGPPPLKAEVQGGVQDIYHLPPCTANTDNGGPVQIGVDVYPCTPGIPSNEGWPAVSGTIDAVTLTGSDGGAREGGRNALYVFRGVVSSETPGAMAAHMGASCAATGTWYKEDCRIFILPPQTITFTPPDDRMWLGYRPMFWVLPSAFQCTDLYTSLFEDAGVPTVPQRVSAAASTSPQPAQSGVLGAGGVPSGPGPFAVLEHPTPTTKRLCMGVAMDSAPPPLHQFNPFFILAERTFVVPGAAKSAKRLTFAAATTATRARLAKVRSWRHGTGRALKVLSRQPFVYTVRATWHDRGAHHRRYEAVITVRSTKKGVSAMLGHIKTK